MDLESGISWWLVIIAGVVIPLGTAAVLVVAL
jgi:hypothetical protein